MNLIIKNRSANRPLSFFSTNLSTKNDAQVPSFDQQIINDPIYCMATQVKRKIVKTSRKKLKYINNTNNFSFVNKQKQQLQPGHQQNDITTCKTVFASHRRNLNFDKCDNLSNTLQNQRKLLSKVTIQRIRSQRQHIQSQTKKIQNSYNYLFNKIQKDKRKSLQIAQKQRKTRQIKQKQKKLKQSLQYQRTALIQQNQLQKSRLRQNVLKQKKNKQKSVLTFYSNIKQNASQVRLQSDYIDQQILRTQLSQIQAKKIKYLTQKQKQKRRLLNRQKSFQNKRLVAQTQFKQRWLKQFNQNTKARRTYLNKKQVLSKKMQQLYKQFITNQSSIRQSQSQSIPKNSIKLQTCLNNPQQRIFNN